MTIKSLDSFIYFVNIILQDYSAGALVHHLTVKIKSNPSPTFLELSAARVVKTLTVLTKVTCIDIDWEFLSRIVASSVAVDSFATPQLMRLVLINPFRSSRRPWLAGHYFELGRYPRLITLVLEGSSQRRQSLFTYNNHNLNPTSNTDTEVLVHEKSNWLSLDHLEVEKKGCELSVDTEDVNDHGEKEEEEQSSTESDFYETDDDSFEEKDNIFALHVRVNLDERDIVDTVLELSPRVIRLDESCINTSGIQTLLQEISPSLLQMHIENDYSLSKHQLQVSRISLYPLISHFSHLKELSITPNVFKRDLFQYLRDPLPLEFLKFDCNTQVDISDLKLLITPGSPAHLSSLKTLDLAVVWGLVGHAPVINLGPYYDSETYEDPGWKLPKWTFSFSRTGLEELILLGRKYGVAIVGDAIDAMEIENEWGKEIELAEQLEIEAEMEATEAE